MLGNIDDALAERRGEVLGHLRIVAPLGFGRRYVAPIVAAFHARHAKASIDLVLSDDLGRVPGGSWDIAVHVGETESAASSLIVRQLAPNQRFVCAAPAYIASRGEPAAPEELEAHACIALRENQEDVTLWRFRPVAGGPETRVRIRPQLASNDGEVVRDWAIAGLGIIVRSEWDVTDDLRDGALVQKLTQGPGPSRCARSCALGVTLSSPRIAHFTDFGCAGGRIAASSLASASPMIDLCALARFDRKVAVLPLEHFGPRGKNEVLHHGA